MEKIETLFETISNLVYERFEEIWVVGGYVRDKLLEQENKDLDFVIVGNVFEFVEELAKILNVSSDNINVFKRFGTVNFTYDGLDLEFVRARTESYSEDSRKPEVEEGTLVEDLNRRDFTINTMAISLNRTTYNELVDIHNGKNDLEDGIIKTPLNPNETFEDDSLRIMRMVRFATRFDFKIDDVTWEGAKNSIERLKIVSQERITDEFLKILANKNAVRGMSLLMDVGAFDIFLPELSVLVGQEQRQDYHHKDVWGHTLDVLGKVVLVEDDVWMRLSGLFHDIGKSKAKAFKEGIGFTFYDHENMGADMLPEIFTRLKLPFSQLSLVETLVRHHGRFRGMESKMSDSAIRRLIHDASPYFDELLIFYFCDYSTHNNRFKERIEETNRLIMERIGKFRDRETKKFQKTESFMSGKEIMELLNLEPGPKVGMVKSALIENTIEGTVTSKEEAISFIKSFVFKN